MGRVDSRDVLDADATTSRAFRGRVVAAYRRTGPNTWDPYHRVTEDGGEIQVLPFMPIHLEKEDARFRMRRRGEVVVVAWLPEPGEVAADEDLHARFLDVCVSHDDPTPEGSLGLWLHGELNRKPEAKD